MTKAFKTIDLQINDEVWIPHAVSWGFNTVGIIYVKHKVIRLTPKKTKVQLDNDKTYSNDFEFYKELDDEMKAIDSKTRNLYHILRSIRQCHDLPVRAWKEYDDETVKKVSDLFTEIIKTCNGKGEKNE